MNKSGLDLARQIAGLKAHKHSDWAWENFLPTVRELVRDGGFQSILEIGAGRFPSFTEAGIASLGARYTANDISARELSLAPDWVGKAMFDVQGSDPNALDGHVGAYDFVFSKMVMEHIASFDQAYGNIHRLLIDGGVGIAFHPVLYSAPFVINRLLPETLSRRVLQAVFSNRTDTDTPKFPARYDGCTISSRTTERLKTMGFRDAWQAPFYGHGYYGKFPLIRDFHQLFTKAVMAKDFTLLATFSYTIVRK